MNIIQFFKKLFNKDIRTGKRYIMRNHTGWGDSIVWTSWPKMEVHGWLQDTPRRGDSLIAHFASGKVIEFVFTSVKPCWDPRDMFFADVKFVQVLSENGEKQ